MTAERWLLVILVAGPILALLGLWLFDMAISGPKKPTQRQTNAKLGTKHTKKENNE